MMDVTPSPQNNVASPLDEKNQHDIEFNYTEKLAELGTNGEVLNAKWDVLKEEANKAEEYEHSFSFWAAVKEYKAVSPQFRFQRMFADYHRLVSGHLSHLCPLLWRVCAPLASLRPRKIDGIRIRLDIYFRSMGYV
jgi:hypothetical protein